MNIKKENLIMKQILLALSLALLVTTLWTISAISQTQTNYALRFYGHGVNDIDRVKIKIDAPAVPADVGATDFTIEFWLKAKLDENSGYANCDTRDGWITANTIIDRDIWGAGDYGDFGIALADGKLVFGVSKGEQGTTICGSTQIADEIWHHIAVTRSQANGALRIYVDGKLDGQGSGPTGNISYRDGRATSYQDDPFLVIGAEKHDAGSGYPSYSGWFDELRLSNNVRYTSNFSPPSAPFAPDASTLALFHFNEGPAGACAGTVVDSSGAAGGPSNGQCRYGGSSPSGPVYVTDIPFGVTIKTPTPVVIYPYKYRVLLPYTTRGTVIDPAPVEQLPASTLVPEATIGPTLSSVPTKPPSPVQSPTPICGGFPFVIFSLSFIRSNVRFGQISI